MIDLWVKLVFDFVFDIDGLFFIEIFVDIFVYGE